MLLIAIALALLVGLSLGLLGGGGSILTVPILRYVLGMEAHQAIALSLLVVGTTSAVALIPHARRGRVRFRTGIIFGAAGMAGAFAAGRIAHLIPAGVLLTAFGAMMFVTAFAMLRPRRAPASASPQGQEPGVAELPVLKVLGEGVLVGAATGLVGAGGGFLVVPALVLLGGLPMDFAVGTSLVVIAMKSLAGFAGFVGHTPVDWTLGLAISGSAVVGSIGGGLLVRFVSPAMLRSGFGWFVITMAFFILAQEVPALLGAEPSVGLAVAASPIGTLLIAGGLWLARRTGGRAAPSEGARSLPPSTPLLDEGREPTA